MWAETTRGDVEIRRVDGEEEIEDWDVNFGSEGGTPDSDGRNCADVWEESNGGNGNRCADEEKGSEEWGEDFGAEGGRQDGGSLNWADEWEKYWMAS